MRVETKKDKIEIVGNYKHIQVREKNIVYDDDDKVIASSNKRFVLNPGDWAGAETHGLTALAQTVWDEDIISAYQAKLSGQV